MKLTIFTSFDQHPELKQSWLQVYNHSLCMPFTSYEWNYQWWLEMKKPKLFTVVAYTNTAEDAVALFPFMIDGCGVLRFIGDIHCDYCDVIVLSTVDKEKLAKNIFKLIQTNNDIKSIELNNLNINHWLIGYLYSFCGYTQLTLLSNASSNVKISKDLGLFGSFVGFRKKQRSELKRIFNKHKTAKSTIYSAENEINFPLDLINEHRLDMINRGDRPTSFFDETLQNVTKELYDSGFLVIHELCFEDKSLSINLCMKSNNRFLIWLDMYKDIPYLNMASYLHFMQNILQNSDEEEIVFDFGRGLYGYKLSNFKPEIIPLVSFVYSKSNLKFSIILIKRFLKLIITPVYKRYKPIINKLLRR